MESSCRVTNFVLFLILSEEKSVGKNTPSMQEVITKFVLRLLEILGFFFDSTYKMT